MVVITNLLSCVLPAYGGNHQPIALRVLPAYGGDRQPIALRVLPAYGGDHQPIALRVLSMIQVAIVTFVVGRVHSRLEWWR